jgi:hypothetical protein
MVKPEESFRVAADGCEEARDLGTLRLSFEQLTHLRGA